MEPNLPEQKVRPNFPGTQIPCRLRSVCCSQVNRPAVSRANAATVSTPFSSRKNPMIPVTSTPELLTDDCESDKMDTMPIVSMKTSGSSVNQMEIEMNDETCVPDVDMETIDSGHLSEERVEEKRFTDASSV